MKFLCGNCKAKYQIADEKVSGRTLRMKCRRCGHDILIDGHSMVQGSAPHPAPAARRGSSAVSVIPGPPRAAAPAVQSGPRTGTSPGLPRPVTRSKPPSGLSADFRRHVAAPPEVPQRNAPYDLWHVAIQDVPVGPMTRDELARKIDAGAVTPESLCWREGMDDWRPLGDLPELAGLLRRSRDGSRASRHRPPPEVPAMHGSRSAPLPTEQDDGEDEGAEPTRISEFTPPPALAAAPAHHGHAGAGASSPKLMVASGSDSGVLVQPVAQPVMPVAVTATKSGAGPASGASWLAVGLLLGILTCAVFYLMLRSPSTPPEVPVAASPTAPKASTREKPVDLEIETVEEEEDQDEPSAPSAHAPSKNQGNRSAKTASASGTKPAKALSDEQRKLLERMGGGANDPDLSRVGTRPIEGGGGGGALPAALTPQQLTKVVQDNKTQLQRCYETALRAAGGKQDGALKISVSVVVGGSGTTKSVSTQGDGLGNMTDCIRQAVKRWRFPQSGGDSEFAFPLVFQPGS